MSKTKLLQSLILIAASSSTFVLADQSVLSPAQQAVIKKTIAKTSAGEKKMINEWPDAKKIGDFFCAKAGLNTFKKQYPVADKVFIGLLGDAAKDLILTGNTQLTGRGSVRLGANWKDFSFDCTLNPVKATVTRFTYNIDK